MSVQDAWHACRHYQVQTVGICIWGALGLGNPCTRATVAKIVAVFAAARVRGMSRGAADRPTMSNKKKKSTGKISRVTQHRYTTSQQQADAKTIVGTGVGVIAAFVTWFCGGTEWMLAQGGVSNGLAEFVLSIVLYVFYGMTFNMTIPAAACQKLVPPFVCDLWHRMHPSGADE